MTKETAITIWFTGLPASGKTTLALALEKRVIELGRACFVLDGDKIREGLSRDLGFSPEDRMENIRRIAEVAKLMNEASLIVIAAFISPLRVHRAMAREIIGARRFFEVCLNTPLEICEARDPKGLYKKARAGVIRDFTGVTSPYEISNDPIVAINTAQISVNDALSLILRSLPLE